MAASGSRSVVVLRHDYDQPSGRLQGWPRDRRYRIQDPYGNGSNRPLRVFRRLHAASLSLSRSLRLRATLHVPHWPFGHTAAEPCGRGYGGVPSILYASFALQDWSIWTMSTATGKNPGGYGSRPMAAPYQASPLPHGDGSGNCAASEKPGPGYRRPSEVGAIRGSDGAEVGAAVRAMTDLAPSSNASLIQLGLSLRTAAAAASISASSSDERYTDTRLSRRDGRSGRFVMMSIVLLGSAPASVRCYGDHRLRQSEEGGSLPI